MLRVAVTLLAAVMRYRWLMFRDRVGFFRPSPKAWERAHRRTGRAIYRLATGLGGALVKLGQVLGARADVFPEAFVAPLRSLHDQVPARPFRKLRKHVERQLGAPVGERFAHIDDVPLAAASLAQVHRARTLDGQDVAVKVQYPEARRLFPTDLGSLRRAVRVVRWLNKKLDLRALADELAEFVCLELDFAREATSTERIRAAFAGDARVRIPRVVPELSRDRLLVLEFVHGVAISDMDRWRGAGALEPRAVAERVAGIYCSMIFEHGFFHGDPHPGNLLVQADGTIAVLDFGLAKELPPGFADGAARMIARGMAGDPAGALEAARSIGFEVGGAEPERFVELVKMLMGERGGPKKLAAVLEASPIEKVPSHFALIGRVFILLNGLSHRLVPGERIIAGSVLRQLGPRVIAAAAS